MSDQEVSAAAQNEDEFVTFVLGSPISYSLKGHQETARTIELRPPAARHSRECAALKQAFFRAVKDQEDSTGAAEAEVDLASPDERKKNGGAGIISVLAMSSSVSLPDTLDVAKKLLTNGVAFVDGEVKLTAHLIDAMSQDDFERLVGDYLANFTLASAFAPSVTPSKNS